ncbi:MAG: WD40 repeat domain-containing protein [Hydrococcus sp. Prado102]|jgi:WD40 repeat protein|nr:WD40 repeat domain-containing protein [Hydrococcus sp. Prado102]
MLLTRLHWLEIAEYLAVILTFFSLLVAIASNLILFPIICLFIALVLNLINRLRFQQLSRKRLLGAVKQLQGQFSQDLQALASDREKIAAPPPPPPSIPADNLAAFQENIVSLERSLNSVVRYLNERNLPERVEQLEKFYAQLEREISYLSQESTETPEITFPQTELPPPIPDIAPIPASHWHCLDTLNAHAEAVASLAISADNRFLASASWDRHLKLWEIATGNLINPAVGHSQGILAVIFLDAKDSDSYELATGSFDRAIKLWSFASDREDKFNLRLQKTLNAHTGSIHALAFAAERQILISGSYDQTLKEWNRKTGEILNSFHDNSGAIYALAISELNRVVASAGSDGRITLWQLETGEKLGTLSGNISTVETLAISPDGRTLAAGCIDGTIKLWELEPSKVISQKPIRILNAHIGQVKSLVFSSDEQTLISGGADGAIAIWHPSSVEAVELLSIVDEGDSRASVCSVAIAPNGQFLAAGSASGKIKLWQRN